MIGGSKRIGSLSRASVVVAAILVASCGSPATQVESPGASSEFSKLTNPSAASGCPSTACSEVTDAVKAGLDVKSSPSALRPPLNTRFADTGFPPLGQCTRLDIPIQNNPAGYSGPCTWMASDAQAPRILLLGDSHATPQWSFAFQQMSSELHYSFGLLAREGCRLGIGLWNTLPRPTGGPPGNQCEDFTSEAIKFANSFNADIVVLATRTKDIPDYTAQEEALFEKGLSQFIAQVKAPNREVYVMSENPRSFAGPACLSAHAANVQVCNAPVSFALSNSSQNVILKAVKEQGVHWINEIPWVCTDSKCPVIIDNYQVYKDPDHLTDTYCVHLIPVLEEAMGLTSPATKTS